MDYCTSENAEWQAVMKTCCPATCGLCGDEQPTPEPEPEPEVPEVPEEPELTDIGDDGFCTSDVPCHWCQGDCDADSDCAGNLKCF